MCSCPSSASNQASAAVGSNSTLAAWSSDTMKGHGSFTSVWGRPSISDTTCFFLAGVSSCAGSTKPIWVKLRDFSRSIVLPFRYSPDSTEPSSRWPRMVYLLRGQVTERQMPWASHSSSPGCAPRARRAADSSADTSLFVTRMHRRWPPSVAFRRLTALSVVALPAKKSTIRALGRSRTTAATASRVA